MCTEDSFTRTGYRKLIEIALKTGYKFISFDDATLSTERNVCLLRHDIDADLGSALEVAKIEAELGIRATYFLMLRSPIYNLLSRANHRIVQKILSMNHWIALHFDENFFPDDRYTMKEWIYLEANTLKEMFGVDISVVSFHQPNMELLQNLKLSNMVNTYNQRDLPEFHYISDSNKSWHSITAYEVFRKAFFRKLHLLIHPMWWVNENQDVSSEESWNRVLLSNLYRTQDQLLKTERAYGAARRFRIFVE